MALAALTFRSSAASTIATRCGALAGDLEKNSESRRASSTGITLRGLAVLADPLQHQEVGMRRGR